MSSRTNATSKSAVTRSTKSPVAACKQPLRKQSECTSCPVQRCTPEKYTTYEHCSTQIELIVKAKGHKKSSAMVSSSPQSQKMLEERKKPANTGERHQSWSQMLRDGIRPVIKEGVGLSTKGHTPRVARLRSKSKELKTKKDVSEQQRNKMNDKSNEQKKRSPQKQIDVHTTCVSSSGKPCTLVTNSVDSIYVMDKAIQSEGIFDHSGVRFNGCNPVRTLGFLMKELEHLVRDEKAAKILSEMEQVLIKIPVNTEKTISVRDLESAALQSKLEACTMQLEETSKEMNAVCEGLREERDSLQRQVHKQVSVLNDAKEKELYLESTIKKLKQEFEEMEKAIQLREKAIIDYKNEAKSYDYSQKIVEDLRADLNNQTELARQRQMDIQYLTLERDKLSVLCSYKDTLLMELRNSIKEMQNHIEGQLSNLKSTYMQDETTNPQASLIHHGIACSSPTSTSSRETNIPLSWRDISDVSVPSVEHNQQNDPQPGRFTHKGTKMVHSTIDPFRGAKRRPTRNISDVQAKDSMQLDFISLPGCESSQTILPSYREAGPIEYGHSGVKEKENAAPHFMRGNKSQELRDSNGETSTGPSRKAHAMKNDNGSQKKRTSDAGTSSDYSRKKSAEGRSDNSEGASNILKGELPTKLIGSTITEQFQNIFEGIRYQSRIPIDVPSPPRNYPNPNWSDSTLPSISANSELNVIQEKNA